MSRPTVHDIAREAGVSLATVDRVLNARPGVREQTIARVQAAVARLGYVRDTSAANLARQREYRFAFVLPEGPGQFTSALRTALREVGSSQAFDRAVTTTVTVPAQDPNAIVRTLRGLGPGRYDGVAIMLPETPQVRDAIARLKGDGVAIVALAADLPNSQRDYFVGINNSAAGRTAALLMGALHRRYGRGTGGHALDARARQPRAPPRLRRGYGAGFRAGDGPCPRSRPSATRSAWGRSSTGSPPGTRGCAESTRWAPATDRSSRRCASADGFTRSP